MCIVDLQDGWRFGAAFLYKGEVHFAMLTHPEDQPFSRERLRRVLRKKAAVILHLHIFTSADLDLHTFTSADTTSSHLHIC